MLELLSLSKTRYRSIQCLRPFGRTHKQAASKTTIDTELENRSRTFHRDFNEKFQLGEKRGADGAKEFSEQVSISVSVLV